MLHITITSNMQHIEQNVLTSVKHLKNVQTSALIIITTIQSLSSETI